jgi:diguanylate cyclase (GGDEF)-like protein/PAS domain S-box-containing protein
MTKPIIRYSPPSGARFRSLDDPETLRTFAHNLGEGIYISNADGDIMDANPAFLELMGIKSLEEMRTYRASELFADPRRREEEVALLEKFGAVKEFELELVRPDGRRITVLDTTYIHRDQNTGETFFHGILVDITKRKELENQLRELSVRDPLTGCYNRRYLGELERQLLARRELLWGCIFVDIDNFKLYNDEYGHDVGDETLRRMSRFLMRQVRAEEPVVRMGGDEFLVVLAGATTRRTEAVAKRLRLAGVEHAPVSFSMGWAARADQEAFEKTVGRADHDLLAVRVAERGTENRGRRVSGQIEKL